MIEIFNKKYILSDILQKIRPGPSPSTQVLSCPLMMLSRLLEILSCCDQSFCGKPIFICKFLQTNPYVEFYKLLPLVCTAKEVRLQIRFCFILTISAGYFDPQSKANFQFN